jgi:hypothetical protein
LIALVNHDTQGDDLESEGSFDTKRHRRTRDGSLDEHRHHQSVPGQVLVLVRARRASAELPLLMRAGLGLALLGAVVDIGYHFATDASGMGHGSIAFIGHTVTLAGMVVTMLGLLGAALKRRPVEAKPRQKGDSR